MIERFKLEFPLEDIKTIGEGIQYLPYHKVAPIIKEIERQVNEQLDAEKSVVSEGSNTIVEE